MLGRVGLRQQFTAVAKVGETQPVRADGFGPAFELFVPRFVVVSVERFLVGDLALTKAIVEQHGGSLGLESEPGGRVYARIRLPLRA